MKDPTTEISGASKQGRNGRGAEESDPKSPSEPIPVNEDAELSETVAEYDIALADRCGPCQMLEPIVETIAAEYGVRGVPTLVLFADGQPAERLVGMQDEAQLRSLIEKHA